MHLIVNCPKNSKIVVGQAVMKLWIKILKMLFGSITQEPFVLPKFDAFFF